jgi:hypothetical protein
VSGDRAAEDRYPSGTVPASAHPGCGRPSECCDPDDPERWQEYELRRAEATAVAFDRLEALEPVIVEAKLSEDPVAGASLALSLEPTRAELVGDLAEVVRRLREGRRSRVPYADTPDARKKRRQRTDDGTLRCIGRGERDSADDGRSRRPPSIGRRLNGSAFPTGFHDPSDVRA